MYLEQIVFSKQPLHYFILFKNNFTKAQQGNVQGKSKKYPHASYKLLKRQKIIGIDKNEQKPETYSRIKDVVHDTKAE